VFSLSRFGFGGRFFVDMFSRVMVFAGVRFAGLDFGGASIELAPAGE